MAGRGESEVELLQCEGDDPGDEAFQPLVTSKCRLVVN
jgi:hypothetical protein